MHNHEFCHLHAHTEASKDGLGPVGSFVGHAKEMGFRSVAMTDHGTLSAVVSFLLAARQAELKPIVGLEGYIAHDGEIGHITLLADGMHGWDSLLKLNNLAHASEWRQPAFTVDQLKEHNDGLVCLTGCIASPLHTLGYTEAKHLAYNLKSVFGGRLFAEMMFIGSLTGWERTLQLSHDVGLQRVITNDVHFTDKHLAPVHRVLTQMRGGFDYESDELYMKSADQLFEAARAFGFDVDDSRDMIQRAGRIADKLGEVHLKAEPRLPYVGTSLMMFADKVRGTKRAHKLLRPDNDYHNRIEYEMKVVSEMGYIDYFVILDDILDEARRIGAKIGPGRGSGAGSLILYFLGITDVDPIKHGLKFERFLNPERRGMPDVDVDIDSGRRDEVIAYAAEKYGGIPISTHLRYGHKSATRAISRVLKMDPDMTAKASDAGENSDAFTDFTLANELALPTYEAVIGQMAHVGKHAGGFIITDKPLPVERISNGLAAAWTEGRYNELSETGFVKLDLLGLSALEALRWLEETYDVQPPEPVDNAPEFAIFREGRMSGIFQFSGSPGIRDLTMELEPCSLADLVAINALWRPGAIDAGSTALYPEWKRHPRKVPAYIESVVRETYGAIVYQEQMMEIYQLTVGGTLAQADQARRLITKAKPDDLKWREQFQETRVNFYKLAQENHGLTATEAQQLWHELETHSRYSFNKSHSVAYSIIAWQCAWWKYHHPAGFYAAMLNSDKKNEQTYIFDAILDGISIVPPHVNVSGNEWSVGGDTIYMPVSVIKFMGQSGADGLIAAREAAGGKFESIAHFMEHTPKSKVRGQAREGLYMTNGFDGLAGDLKTRDEAVKVLGLKPENIALMDDKERQLKYLGFSIPTPKVLERHKKAEAAGYTCGIVVKIDQRSSRYGPYKVFTLAPNGGFWARNDDVKRIEKGMMVIVDKSPKGKATRIKIL